MVYARCHLQIAAKADVCACWALPSWPSPQLHDHNARRTEPGRVLQYPPTMAPVLLGSIAHHTSK